MRGASETWTGPSSKRYRLSEGREQNGETRVTRLERWKEGRERIDSINEEVGFIKRVFQPNDL